MISKGYCRAFHIQDGVEVNTTFYFENEIATNINSYLTQAKSSFSIIACEPVTAYRFDKNKVLEGSKLSHEIEIAHLSSGDSIWLEVGHLFFFVTLVVSYIYFYKIEHVKLSFSKPRFSQKKDKPDKVLS